jgi:hypothetical protein
LGKIDEPIAAPLELRNHITGTARAAGFSHACNRLAQRASRVMPQATGRGERKVMRDWLMPICGGIIGAAVLGALVLAANSYVNDPNRTKLFGVTDSSNQSQPSGAKP